ncbi:MAG: c-type cytochrome [Polyangiales bacterium]
MTEEAFQRAPTNGSPRDTSSLRPSASLLTAALAGLLAVGAAGCDEDENGNPICDAPVAPPAPTGNVPAPAALDGGIAAPATPAPTVDAGRDIWVGEDQKVFRSLSSLRQDCDSKGGYIQLHAACAGSNSCQGFSYWSPKPGVTGPGVLNEHACSSANGCRGASCVVMPKDRGRTGKEVYEDEELPSFGPTRCGACHAVNGPNHGDPADYTKFKVWHMPGDTTRNANNWLQKSAAEQESIVAFGKNNFFSDGTAQVNMLGYHKLLSRDEIKKVVAHIRTLQPVISEVPVPPEVMPQ